MDINGAVSAIEAFVKGFAFSGATPVEVQVRPSGDDIDVIKIWVDVGSAKVDTEAYAEALEAGVKKNVKEAAAFKLSVRAEAGS
jgi:hypothetical protein